MFFFFGQRLGGIVGRTDRSRIGTVFFHLNGVPLAPHRSVLFLADGREVELGLHGPSVAAGYLRGWGAAAVLLGGLAAMFGVGTAGWAAVAAGAAMGLVGLALGRVGADAADRLAVYERHAGVLADVARLDAADREAIAARLRPEVIDRARTHAARGYRDATDPAAWDRIALDPAVEDRELLGAGLTLARLSYPDARGEERRRLSRVHDALWRRLSRLTRG